MMMTCSSVVVLTVRSSGNCSFFVLSKVPGMLAGWRAKGEKDVRRFSPMSMSDKRWDKESNRVLQSPIIATVIGKIRIALGLDLSGSRFKHISHLHHHASPVASVSEPQLLDPGPLHHRLFLGFSTLAILGP
jgi:hypothetical protein